MALLINNTAINPNTNDVFVNNVAQNKVYTNNVLVWERVRDKIILEGGTSHYGGLNNALRDSASGTHAEINQYGWYMQGAGRFQIGLDNLVSFAGYTKLNFRASHFSYPNSPDSWLMCGYSESAKRDWWLHVDYPGQQRVQMNGTSFGGTGLGTLTMNINPANTSGHIQLQVLLGGVNNPMSIYVNKIWLSN